MLIGRPSRAAIVIITMLLGSLFVGLWVTADLGRGLSMFGLLSFVAAVIIVMFGPATVRVDLRQDLAQLAIIKTWPVSGAAVFRGELLAPLIALSVGAGLPILLGSALDDKMMLGPGASPAVRAGFAVAALLVATTLVLAQLVIQNGIAVTFPAWVRVTPDGSIGGVERMGQMMITLYGGLLGAGAGRDRARRGRRGRLVSGRRVVDGALDTQRRLCGDARPRMRRRGRDIRPHPGPRRSAGCRDSGVINGQEARTPRQVRTRHAVASARVSQSPDARPPGRQGRARHDIARQGRPGAPEARTETGAGAPQARQGIQGHARDHEEARREGTDTEDREGWTRAEDGGETASSVRRRGLVVRYPVPFFGGGIIPRLEKKLGVPILNLAKAGDEVRYMLGVKERKILIEQFTRGCPAGGPWDAMLFSGGGNDLVDNPMALWIRDYNAKLPPAALIHQARLDAAFALVRAGYEDLIALRDGMSPQTRLFFHGYDFAIPDGRGICHLGPWLKPTFDLRGFPTQASRFDVTKILLRQFATMLQSLESSHANVTFINGQGTLAPYTSSWHNELHPAKNGFNAFAALFHQTLKAAFPNRVL